MERGKRRELGKLLKEAEYAYRIALRAGGNMNEDFASFAGRSWASEFRRILDMPCLTSDELSSLIRRARQQGFVRDDMSWSGQVASFIARNITRPVMVSQTA